MTTFQNVPADSISQENKKIKGEIVYIPVEKLHPHEDNPRKDVGDVTELAESIKANGILQNLTVVPATGHYYGDYTVIIGHRRLAAAKLAGLTELPCVVVEMSPKEQVSTMLTENMQRSDLTLYEQAQGFQMMIDFGDTVEEVAEKSGFSQTTVRKRLKIAKLKDKDSFEAAQFRGGTIEDFIAIAEIKDEKTRNELTKLVGTNNFAWSLKKAQDAQIRAEMMPEIEGELASFGAKKNGKLHSWTEGYDRVKEIYITDYKGGDFQRATMLYEADKGADREYEWNAYNNYVCLMAKTAVAGKSEKGSSEREKKQLLKEELNAAAKRSYELRRDWVNRGGYVAELVLRPKQLLVSYLFRFTARDELELDADDIEELLEEEIREDEEIFEYNKRLEAAAAKYALESPWRAMFEYIYKGFRDSEIRKYHDYNCTHTENSNLDLLYRFLCTYGYEMSDEEKALQDGTHELFKDMESED